MRGDRSTLLLLWLAGISLRATALAVPPLLPVMHQQLHLDEAAIGALTALPVFLLAVAAVPGSLMVARLGARHALLVGLALIGVTGAVRGLGSSAFVLFAATVLMGCGIAVCQPALPSLVRSWLPSRVALATASFSNGILIGEILPVALTASVFLPLLGGWEPALAIWSVPVILTAVAIVLVTKSEVPDVARGAARWWPDWHDRRVWLLGLTLGGASASYWGANAFLPELLRNGHHSSYITAALTSLNLGQIPASLVVAIAPSRVVARSWPLVLAGALVIGSSVGILVLPPEGLVVDVAILGLSSAGVFVLALTLPPLIADAGDTHRISAAMFTISYVCPFVGSLVGGALWDFTGVPQMAFVSVILGGVMMLAFPTMLDLTAARHRLLRTDPYGEPVLPG